MPTSIAVLTPADQTIQHRQVDQAAPDVPDMSFSELWQDKKEGLSFGDFLDIINPLQHIPVVSTIYRMVTGDEIGVGSRLAGGALFGGPLGLLGAGVVAAFESISGEIVEKQVASVWKDLTGDDATPQLAEAKTDAGAVATAAPRSAAAAQAEPVVPALAAAADAKPEVPAAAPLKPDQIAAAAAPEAAAQAMTVAMAHPVNPGFRPPPSRIYIQGPAHPSPAAARAAAAAEPADHKPAPGKAEDDAAARQRIQQAIEKAQRAQAGLLLANIAAEPSPARATDDKDGAQAITSQPQPFRSHPFMLPPGAPPEMINKAMAQALNRYEAILQQRNATVTPAAPRAVAAPVR